MNILVQGKKYQLKLEPRVVKSINIGKVTLDDIFNTLTENDNLLDRTY